MIQLEWPYNLLLWVAIAGVILYMMRAFFAGGVCRSTAKILCNGIDEINFAKLLDRKTLKFLFGWLVFKTAKEGAQTTIHLAVSEDVKGITGKYFSDCKEKAPNKPALDEEAAEQLWVKSVEWTGL